MSEECKVCHGKEASLYKIVQNNKRLEERVSILIGYVARAQVRNWDNEYELRKVKVLLTGMELQNKYLYDHNEKLAERISALEKGEGFLGDRKKLRNA
ncbi:hypothetical protein [Bacillus sp. mrc49]|uniref:hypothetical protein n=1 Tax=Bacillus sp. mrc49 TaxID=2054913 RepID=UPI000C2790CB|nr:hypothetical protein [Bacillus sp. mrc49]PJN88245.1 hypothetical protein CVN76_21545 [Bacillus sp. mrc49]